MKIGIFDSGIGGLTVLKAIRERYPLTDIIYLGDTARVPYGTRSRETVIRYSLECADFLLARDIDILVIACNTASSYAIDELSSHSPVPVVGVVKPGVEEALRHTSGRVGVIGTRGTIASGSYQRLLRESGVYTVARPCPLFVPLVEEGLTDGPIALEVAKLYLTEMKESGIDTLILGCTHYPLLKKVISQVLESTAIIDSSEAVARSISEIVRDEGKGELHLFFTDDSPNLPSMIRQVLGKELSYEVVKEVPKT